MRTRYLRVVALCLFVLAVASVPAAAQWITGTLSNFDAWNWSGQEANDFHIKLDGINANQLGQFWLGSYPNVTVSQTPTGSDITWTGGATTSGDKAHFGFTVDGPTNLAGGTIEWTKDGVSIDKMPDVKQKWIWLVSQIVQDDITNRSIRPVWIQRRVATLPNWLNLGDLLRGGNVWNLGVIVDQTPVLLNPSQTLLYDFAWTRANVSYVMMYDVWADNNGTPGDQLFTYLNAAQVPEPATASMLVVGLLGAVGYVRRRR